MNRTIKKLLGFGLTVMVLGSLSACSRGASERPTSYSGNTTSPGITNQENGNTTGGTTGTGGGMTGTSGGTGGTSGTGTSGSSGSQ